MCHPSPSCLGCESSPCPACPWYTCSPPVSLFLFVFLILDCHHITVLVLEKQLFYLIMVHPCNFYYSILLSLFCFVISCCQSPTVPNFYYTLSEICMYIGSIQFMVSDIHWGSWNVFPGNKERLPNTEAERKVGRTKGGWKKGGRN